MHAQALGHFPQPRSRRREEPSPGQFPQPRLPVLHAAAQPLQDRAQFRRDHRLALAEEPTGVVHQQQLGAWNDPEIVRIVGLLGKRGIEAHFDRELNSLFHAFDALGNRMGQKFWQERRDRLPLGYIGGFEFVPYRAIAPPARDATAAMAVIRSVFDERVGRLEELLAAHEAIEAAERHDRAALDCSREFERHRRYQSARTRELLSTLETLRKMRNEEFGTKNGEAVTADGKCPMADDACQVESGGCDQEPSSEPVTEGSRDPVVGHDSHLVVDDTMKGTMGILPHEVTDAAEVVCQGDDVGQDLGDEVITPQKAPNKGNSDSRQCPESQALKSENAEVDGRKQSQISAGETSSEPGPGDGQPTPTDTAEWTGHGILIRNFEGLAPVDRYANSRTLEP